MFPFRFLQVKGFRMNAFAAIHRTALPSAGDDFRPDERDPAMVRYGDRVRAWRTSRGLPVLDAARRLGLSRFVFELLEGGRMSPSPSLAMRLRESFGFAPGDDEGAADDANLSGETELGAARAVPGARKKGGQPPVASAQTSGGGAPPPGSPAAVASLPDAWRAPLETCPAPFACLARADNGQTGDASPPQLLLWCEGRQRFLSVGEARGLALELELLLALLDKKGGPDGDA